VFNIDTLIGGGVAGGFVTILGGILYILLNKKVKTPADNAASERAGIVERNELMGQLRTDMSDLRKELHSARQKIDQQDSEIDALKQEALERDHYIYRCIHVIQRLGEPSDIPEPSPFSKK
jgi:septal ring factor EnvC (AmiA/AmiB activator)